MEPKFVNKFYGDEKRVKEFVYKISMKPIYIIGTVFIVFCAILNLPMLIYYGKVEIPVVAVMVIYAVLTYVVMPKVHIYRQKKTAKALYGDDDLPQATISVTDDEVVVEEGSNRTSFKLESVKALICKKTIFALCVRKTGHRIMIAPDGFEVGSLQEFKNFLLSKGVKVKWKSIKK